MATHSQAPIARDQTLQTKKSYSDSLSENADSRDIQPKQNPISRLFGLILFWSRRYPRLYAPLLECHSFVCRIRLMLVSEEYRSRYRHRFDKSVDAGPFLESCDGGYQICTRTQQRIQDMRRIFQMELPEAPVDALHLQLFFQGWNCGEEWARKCHGSGNIPLHAREDQTPP